MPDGTNDPIVALLSTKYGMTPEQAGSYAPTVRAGMAPGASAIMEEAMAPVGNRALGEQQTMQEYARIYNNKVNGAPVSSSEEDFLRSMADAHRRRVQEHAAKLENEKGTALAEEAGRHISFMKDQSASLDAIKAPVPPDNEAILRSLGYEKAAQRVSNKEKVGPTIHVARHEYDPSVPKPAVIPLSKMAPLPPPPAAPTMGEGLYLDALQYLGQGK